MNENKKTDTRFANIRKRANYIRAAIEKPAIARVFFLILDGKNYTKEIAQAYYSSGKNKKMKSSQAGNPKVIAIYLSTLKEAGLIKKKEKEGKIQRYEIDWNGLFDVISLGNKSEFAEAYWNVGYGNMNYTEVEKINEFFIENFVRPYFVKRKDELKLAYSYLIHGGKELRDIIYSSPSHERHTLNKEDGTDFCKTPKEFDNVDFNLDSEFKTISAIIVGPYHYNTELVIKFLNKKSNRKSPIFVIFEFIKRNNENIERLTITQNNEDSKKCITDKIIGILNS